ncbi:tetratricopeptide repeat protein 19, mitochondrial-like [Tetranychus urticae]|uniref:MalT-like TPR region domain-containing protein n=1 Tax=Tetranychus urticae TaxID=32264 RepID=T1KRV3_TETUR|nr:tetratricopeptide repeat protein 19, mitochondrial-like [Tetranychus urticae]XP_015789916.1 tetratricopeptide repeat protein 19, mitochondrial-like [Tetranychus urticae]
MFVSRFLFKTVTSPLTCKLCHHGLRLSVPSAYLPSLVQMSTRNVDRSSNFKKLTIVSKTRQSRNSKGDRNRPLLAAGFISGLLSLLGWEDLLSKEDPFILTIKRGILCMQREEFDKAEIILHAALSNAVDMGNSKAIAYIYSLMGNVAFLKGDYEKSEKIYKDLIKRLLEFGIEEDHEAIVEISLKLATIYSKLGKFSKADVGFSHCLSIQKKRANQIENDKKTKNELSDSDINSLALYGMALDFYGKHLLRKQEYDGALKYTLDALAVCEKVNGKNAHQTMILLSDVGTLLNLTNNFDEADEYFKKAIKVGTIIESDHLKTLYYNVGMNDLMRRNWPSAQQNCDASYRFAKKDDDIYIMGMAEDCLKKIRAQVVQ